jgi:hypothetical protein
MVLLLSPTDGPFGVLGRSDTQSWRRYQLKALGLAGGWGTGARRDVGPEHVPG